MQESEIERMCMWVYVCVLREGERERESACVRVYDEKKKKQGEL